MGVGYHLWEMAYSQTLVNGSCGPVVKMPGLQEGDPGSNPGYCPFSLQWCQDDPELMCSWLGPVEGEGRGVRGGSSVVEMAYSQTLVSGGRGLVVKMPDLQRCGRKTQVQILATAHFHYN